MTQLASLLKQESELIGALLTLLAQEQTVLTEGSPEELEALSSAKMQLLNEIEHAASLRNDELKKQGAPLEAGSLPAWLAANPLQSAAWLTWQSLIKLTAEAKQRHDTNRLLLDALQRQTGEALVILTQYQQQHSLYGKDGQASASLGNRIVDSA